MVESCLYTSRKFEWNIAEVGKRSLLSSIRSPFQLVVFPLLSLWLFHKKMGRDPGSSLFFRVCLRVDEMHIPIQYPLVKCSYWKWPFIVDFPIKHGGSFQFAMLVITRGYMRAHSGCLVTSLVTSSRWELWTNLMTCVTSDLWRAPKKRTQKHQSTWNIGYIT